ncbi:DUF4214 domain-containing protein [Tianweitania sediminis]|uniref:DUF4214 domain-containing protein n=1 Tax=Tianweitania sediminis TaxID=1502156 RepID=A0A8J7UHW6_9HYPH|nr:DUF4214 domain-containing protein [Tianweitania sediminis]MBP0437084.1 DUF4214 domain-containing protein [Tianweitania sediminis]
MATIDIINTLYANLLGRPSDAAGVDYWIDQVESGAVSLAQVVAAFAASVEARQDIVPIVQLYYSAFGRAPDAAGLRYWVDARRDGMSMEDIARAFSASAEFSGQYEDDAASAVFVAAIYQNALGRAPDAEGLAYWTNLLAQGESPARLLLMVATSAESTQHNDAATQVVLVYHGLLGRAPTQAEIADALGNGSTTPDFLEDLAESLLDGAPSEPTQPETPGQPGGPVEPQPQPEPITFLPNAGTGENSSDTSTAIALPDDYILVGDDEANVLRVYHRDGGPAVLEWSYDAAIGGDGELDLEASALVGNTLYLVGSHGNSKSGGEADNREILFSVELQGTGAATTFTINGAYTGLEAALVAWDAGNAHGQGANYFGFAASSAAGSSPEQPSGFAVEGATTSPDDGALWLGFRAPQTDTTTRDKALIVPLENYAELVNGSETDATFGAPIELNLGGRGIRSIEKATDGSGYVIIAGSAAPSSGAVEHNFRLFTWDGTTGSQPVERDTDLDALLAQTGGSFETLVSPASIKEGTQLLLLQDNGDTVWPGQTDGSKDLPASEQQFQGNVVTLGRAVVDQTGPRLVEASPADGTQGAAVDTAFVLSFNEGVARGEGTATLRDATGAVVESFDLATSTQISFNYNVVTLRPSTDLSFETAYTLQIENGAIVDHFGNAFRGITPADPLDLITSAPPTILSAGDVLFVGGNAEAPDAIAFILMTDITGGTRITFTDRDYDASTGFNGITNEAAFTWTAGRDLPAGTIVTIQTDTNGNPVADIGTTKGGGGGVGKSETYYALQGAVIDGLVDGGAGVITNPGTFVASLTLGGSAGAIPVELTNAGAALSFTVNPANQTNARYSGSLDASDLQSLAASIKDPLNWEANHTKAPGFALVNGSLFGAPLVSNASTDGAVISVTFNQALLAGTTERPNNAAFTVTLDGVDVTPASVTITGDTLSLTLPSAIAAGSIISLAYADPTAGDDAQALQSLSGADVLSFTGVNIVNLAPDNVAPQVTGISLGGDDVAPFADLVINFDEVVQKGSGTIVLENQSGGADVTIDVSDAAVFVSGNRVTVDFASLLALNTEYQVSIGTGAFADTMNNPMAAYDSTAFSTIDALPDYSLLITEVNSNASGGDFFEIYNYGDTAIDLSNWRYSDSAGTFSGGVALAENTLIAPGQTLIVAVVENDAEMAEFRAAWGLADSVAVVGLDGAGLGKSDAVVLFDQNGYVATAFNYGAATVNASDGSAIGTSDTVGSFKAEQHAGAAFGGNAKASAVWDGVSWNDPAYQVAIVGSAGGYAQAGDASSVGSPGFVPVA